jgi:hypothetical protein
VSETEKKLSKMHQVGNVMMMKSKLHEKNILIIIHNPSGCGSQFSNKTSLNASKQRHQLQKGSSTTQSSTCTYNNNNNNNNSSSSGSNKVN